MKPIFKTLCSTEGEIGERSEVKAAEKRSNGIGAVDASAPLAKCSNLLNLKTGFFPNAGPLCTTPDTSIFDNFLTEWLTTPAAAKFLGISPGSLRNMTSDGRVPFHKLGRRNRYRLEDLRALLLKERRGPNGN
jgi:excisionase family DNA binding protein